MKGDDLLFEVATLAVRGTITTPEIASNEPTFGLIRSPGHQCWQEPRRWFLLFQQHGHGYPEIHPREKINNALRGDIDLHHGNSTYNVLGDREEIIFLNMDCQERQRYLTQFRKNLEEGKGYGVTGVSAEFDTCQKGWRGGLKTKDYKTTCQEHEKTTSGLLSLVYP